MSSTPPQLTLFPGATPASPTAPPGSAAARQTTVRSGHRCTGLLTVSGPLGSLVRMLLTTSTWASPLCSLTWKPRAMPCGRWLFRLVPSVPPTSASGSGFWPTPTSTDAGSGRVNRSPSPGARPRPTLALLVRLLPTPLANDAQNPQAYPSRLNRSRPSAYQGLAAALSHLQPEPAGGLLNPRFVLELMGFPPDWCDLTEIQMQQVRRQLRPTRKPGPATP